MARKIEPVLAESERDDAADAAGPSLLWYLPTMTTRKIVAKTASPKGKKFVLGRVRLEKISAVEGIRTSGATRKMFADFEKRGLSHEERRAAIFKKYANRA